jgi:F420-dependent oxidoreductase-like protein
MRFGAFVPQGWRLDLAGIAVTDHWQTIATAATKIESLGYESLWVYDHFHTIPVPTQEVTYEAWTLMSALAASTTSVRLGQMCTCNTYRNPAYLAKVAASIDVISNGRLEMGIGAGWYEHEHDGYGYPFLPPGQRLGMLREGVEILRALWTQDEVTHEGRHYRLSGAISQPKPLQKPHIPLWIAGGGEKVTLRIAAEHGSYSNFGMVLDNFIRKSGLLREHCEDLGTDFDAIVRSANFNIMLAETESGVEDKIRWLEDHLGKYVPRDRAERFAETYRDFSGTPDQVISTLREWEKEGMSYAILNFADIAFDTTSLELFAREVVPAFA